jgi:hypothetical protein
MRVGGSTLSCPVCAELPSAVQNEATARLKKNTRHDGPLSFSQAHSLLLHANAELIPGTNYFAVFDHEFKQFFALHRAAGFVL